MSDWKTSAKLVKGQIGKLLRFDRHGDAQFQFYDHEDLLWVLKGNFCKLLDRLEAARRSINVEEIDKACAAAEAAGAENHRVATLRERARWLRETTARLETAERDGNVEEGIHACDQAELAGLDAYRIALLRQKLGRMQALTKLEAAEQGADADVMDRACTEAEVSGVDSGKVSEVRQRAWKIRAEARLDLVVQGISSEEMDWACDAAEAGGIEDSKTGPVRHKAMMIRETWSRLKTAEQGGNGDELEQAFDEAFRAGLVDAGQVEAAQAKAKTMRIITNLEAARRGHDPQEMDRACADAEAVRADGIEAVREKARQIRATTSRLEAALREFDQWMREMGYRKLQDIEEGHEIMVQEGFVTDWHDNVSLTVGQLGKVVSFDSYGDAAIDFYDHTGVQTVLKRHFWKLVNVNEAYERGLEELEAACDAAEAAGCDIREITPCRHKARLYRATIKLEAAETSSSVEEIECACEQALIAGADIHKVAYLRQKANRMRATARLKALNEDSSVEEMEQACDEAEAAGSEAHSIGEIRQKVRRMRVLARLDFVEVVNNGSSPEDMEAACDDAEALGLGGVRRLAAIRQKATLLRFIPQIEAVKESENPEEIEGMCAQAEAAVADVPEKIAEMVNDVVLQIREIVVEPRQRVRLLRSIAWLDAVEEQGDDYLEMERACDEGEAAGAPEAKVAWVRRLAQDLRDAEADYAEEGEEEEGGLDEPAN